MTFKSHTLSAYAWLFLASAGTAGCLCPPCPGKGVVAGPAAVAAAPAATGAPAAAAGPVATGSKLMIWDGDNAGTGAQGWESCDQKPACQVKAAMAPGVGVEGSNGLKFHGEGSGWIGMGWNLFGWYPENAGVDLSPYTHLTFQVKVDMKPAADGSRDPGAAAVLLGCSRNKFDSTDAPIDKFMKGFADGQWHKVAIPVSHFTKGKGAKFDPTSFWEFRISTWGGTTRTFDIIIDDIAAEKQ